MTDALAATAATTPTSKGANAANLAAGQSNLNTGFSTFLTLLTTQLQHQDPTSPLDTNAFTQQLVSMTGVQQQLLSNQLLQQLVSASSGGSGVAGAVGMIGKTVTASSSQATLAGGEAGWTYSLAAPAANATLSVVSASGQTVWTGPASALSAGDHGFTWKGQDSSGRQLADGGKYTLKIAAADAYGGAVPSNVSVRGVVTGVTTQNGQTLLNLGSSQVPLSEVTAVGGT